MTEICDNQEVIEIAEDDHWKAQTLEFLGLLLEASGHQPVLTRGLNDIASFGAVAGHATRNSQLFKRHSQPEIAEDDRQPGRAALNGFHLHRGLISQARERTTPRFTEDVC